jgi:hypothetical protein
MPEAWPRGRQGLSRHYHIERKYRNSHTAPEMQMIVKPYAGELQVRFDEGEHDFVPRTNLNGHEAGNSGHSQGSTYKMMSLFSTLPID